MVYVEEEFFDNYDDILYIKEKVFKNAIQGKFFRKRCLKLCEHEIESFKNEPKPFNELIL